ncbi:MAG: sporulation protein YqfD [Firmicutes bacterium]|nr:sporulation protein YqfD [Bacillota bacterium]
MAVRVAEWITGYVRVRVVDDPDRRVLGALIERRAQLWDVRSERDNGEYTCCVTLTDIRLLLAVARRHRAKIRFGRKSGVPFLLWRASRRKVFLAGGLLFTILLYVLSSFVWHVEIDGTDQPEAVASALQKLHVRPGTALYQILDQDSLQLALLDQLPQIAWVGVRIQGTAVYVHVIPRVASADPVVHKPQSIVAAVPGVVSSVLADSGLPLVKPGQFVTPGTVLISGSLLDGKAVYAKGTVRALVWYRSQLELPERLAVAGITGDAVHHYYLMIGNWPVQVWGFARPPYTRELVHSVESPLEIAGIHLPFTWRSETVYEAATHVSVRSPQELAKQGLGMAAQDVLREASDEAKVLHQAILQKKLERGKLYMTVWTEVEENIGRPQQIVPAPPAPVAPLHQGQ